ncbi:MAG: hypothetical protein LC746_14340 [Acidobacteria bacterium]|nr:hypothetical protein [Acidobacteriota bacterium]
MADAKGSDFYVGLQGIKLPKDAEERIANAIRRAVTRELASLDLRPARGRSGTGGGGKAPTKGGAGGTGSVPSVINKKNWYGFILLKALGGFQGVSVDAGKNIQTQNFQQGVR